MASKRSGTLVAIPLLEYLQGLPSAQLTRLYGNSASCLAVFRALPTLATQYLMRMVFLDQSLPLSVVNSWPQPSPVGQSAHRAALTALRDVSILENVSMGGQSAVRINEMFKNNLKILLCGGGAPWSRSGHRGETKHSRDVDFLNNYADTQWEGVLNFMVGTARVSSVNVAQVLLNAGLMSSASSTSAAITSTGFQFLLLDRQTQVWHFILQYFASAEARDLNLVECLNFIFQLNFYTLGKDYSAEGLTKSQLEFIESLREFGLVYLRKKSSKRFYPTKLAIGLIAGEQPTTTGSTASPVARQPTAQGYLMLETNYRVIAYTDSPLQIGILEKFCHLQYRFPNMVVGTITRESAYQAFRKGITADQILKYLHLHAHPEMLTSNPVIPSTVSDQVRLWEQERDRLSFSDGVLYSEFLSATDFEKVRKYAEDLGVLVWGSNGRRLMVVSADGHDEVRRFWKRQKHS